MEQPNKSNDKNSDQRFLMLVDVIDTYSEDLEQVAHATDFVSGVTPFIDSSLVIGSIARDMREYLEEEQAVIKELAEEAEEEEKPKHDADCDICGDCGHCRTHCKDCQDD